MWQIRFSAHKCNISIVCPSLGLQDYIKIFSASARSHSSYIYKLPQQYFFGAFKPLQIITFSKNLNKIQNNFIDKFDEKNRKSGTNDSLFRAVEVRSLGYLPNAKLSPE